MSNNQNFGSMIRKIKTADEYIVSELYNSFSDGSYEFKDEDLPYMTIVKENNHTAILPMLNLLKEVNHIHRNGLDID